MRVGIEQPQARLTWATLSLIAVSAVIFLKSALSKYTAVV
jgi:hypothetical protein